MAMQFEYSAGSFTGSTLMLIVVFLRQCLFPVAIVYYDDYPQMQLIFFLLVNLLILLSIAET